MQIKAQGWIKEYKEKSLVSGDKSVRITIEFQDNSLGIIKQLAGYLADVPYTITINDNE